VGGDRERLVAATVPPPSAAPPVPASRNAAPTAGPRTFPPLWQPHPAPDKPTRVNGARRAEDKGDDWYSPRNPPTGAPGVKAGATAPPARPPTQAIEVYAADLLGVLGPLWDYIYFFFQVRNAGR
jgi:hypothetical protein